ncbi:hypothetical protein [Deinococcus kurensis]|uniref:hypothetical protein n=1 Tax=Deinococcus kurensis TaxID=2662757 RepID=UPI0012D305F2|nr:hypothetical protein [Deinococcus kurensis]
MTMAPATDAHRAAELLGNPVRTWAVQHALRTGHVTTRHVAQEWPMYTPSHVYVTLHALVSKGWLRRDPGQPVRLPYGEYQRFLPGDLTGLHALHAELTALLALMPTPEVPR